MDERYIAAIDLGSHKIAISVAQVTGQNVQIIYYAEVPSKGIKYSGVLNPKKVSEQVKELINKAENELRINILQAVLNLPRWEVRQEQANASLQRSDADSSIEQEEIEFLKAQSRSYPLTDEEKEDIYGIIAQSFNTDDYLNADENDIVGMVCDKLEGNFKAYIGNRRKSKNVDMVMNTLGRATSCKLFTPEYTAKAVLSEEEMANGVALVELGGDVTSVSIFKKGILRYYSSIPFGGRSITDDIRIECGISEKLAENIKLAYGVCMPEKLQVLRDKIIQINNNESGTSKQLSVKYLSEIITARLEEIIQASLYKIQASGFADDLISGVVITGGVAQTANLCTYFKELSGYDVRIGYPLRCKFSYAECNEVTETSASTIVGMILQAKDDLHLNCLTMQPAAEEKVSYEQATEEKEEVAETREPEVVDPQKAISDFFTTEPKADEPVQETYVESEPAYEDAEEVEEPIQEIKTEEEAEEEEKPKKKKKPARQSLFTKFGNLIWNKASNIGDMIYDLTEDSED